MRLALLRVAIPFLLAAVAGCSISESLSDSVSSPFESSSNLIKSSSEGREQAYADDVADYTASYARSNPAPEGLIEELSSVAAKRGITAYDSLETTYVAIGSGLRRANVTPVQLEAYKIAVASGDPARAAAMQKGFGQID